MASSASRDAQEFTTAIVVCLLVATALGVMSCVWGSADSVKETRVIRDDLVVTSTERYRLQNGSLIETITVRTRSTSTEE